MRRKTCNMCSDSGKRQSSLSAIAATVKASGANVARKAPDCKAIEAPTAFA